MKYMSVIAVFHICLQIHVLFLILVYHCCTNNDNNNRFEDWLRHLVFLGFVGWVSLILCFADSFCFVKSVPAGIPESGAYL